MSVTVAEKSKAYRKRKAAKLQRLAAYEVALERIANLPDLLDASYHCKNIARQALAADRFELENGA